MGAVFSSSSSSPLDNVYFTYDNNNKVKGTSVVQYVVLATVQGITFPIAKFVPSDKMYQCGLEKNRKHLVDIPELADHLCFLLRSYVDAEVFNRDRYEAAMFAYKKFLDANLVYESFLSKVRSALDNGGWE